LKTSRIAVVIEKIANARQEMNSGLEPFSSPVGIPVFMPTRRSVARISRIGSGLPTDQTESN
jgi:hypothetical protein